MSIRLPQKGDKWDKYEVTEDYIPGSVVYVQTTNADRSKGVFPWREWKGIGGGKDPKLDSEVYHQIEMLNEIGHRTLESQRDATLFLLDLVLELGKEIPQGTVASLKYMKGVEAFKEWTCSREATLPGLLEVLAERWKMVEDESNEELFE